MKGGAGRHGERGEKASGAASETASGVASETASGAASGMASRTASGGTAGGGTLGEVHSKGVKQGESEAERGTDVQVLRVVMLVPHLVPTDATF